MAVYFGLTSEKVPRSEQKVAEALRSLPDDWYVLHSVAWQSMRRGREGDGEADFILLHAKHGCLILEVKGGDITLQAGRWKSESANGTIFDIKNPYEQAKDSKHALRRWIAERFPHVRLIIGHAVVFPDLQFVSGLGPEAAPEITWCGRDLKEIEEAIKRAVNHWGTQSLCQPRDLENLIGSLAPTIAVRRKLSDTSMESENALLRLTAEQIDFYSKIRASRGGCILGGAGTGKTILAVARARQLASDGFETLLVCYNELLGRSFERELQTEPLLSASTFHSLCMRLGRRARISIPESPQSGWWEEEAPSVLVQAAAELNYSADAIVVDEGQDFAPAWLDALRCLQTRTKDAPFFLFADPNQELWPRQWIPDEPWGFCSELSFNLRNTRPIAEKVASAIQSPIPTRGPEGPRPKWIETKVGVDGFQGALKAVEQLIDEGFGPSRLAVLCSSAETVRRLREVTVGNYSLGTWGSKGIPVETVARFKGLESEALILVLGTDDSNVDRTHIYVGLSRARSVLYVVGPPAIKSQIGWAEAN